jgi:DNA-binding CsgD family transcriptional regulator
VPLGKPLLDVLDRMGHGGFVLDTAGQVTQVNGTARRLFSEVAGQGHREDDPDWVRRALKKLLRSESTRFRMDEDAWVAIRRDADHRRPLVLHAVPIADRAASGPHTVVILVDLDETPRPQADALQKIFGLTPAEARLAIELATGKSSDEVADAAGVKVATVRKQLASVFAKTNTRRQPELIALLVRVSILP